MFSANEIHKDIFSLEINDPREEKDETEFLSFLDSVLSKNTFGLILKVEGEKSFSPEAKKALGVWFKENKPILKSKCFGFARVNQNAKKMGRLKSKALSLAMPCPYTVLHTTEEALDWLKR